MDYRLLPLLLLSCMSLNAHAFPHSRRRAPILRTATLRRSRRFHRHDAARAVHRICTLNQANSEGEEYPLDRRRQSSMVRRSMMLKSLGSVVLSTTAAANPRTNAIDLPNFLVTDTATAPETRVNNGMPVPTKRAGGLSNKIRNVIKIMDELQRDMMLNKWDLIEGYPNQLRSYVPIFTAYTDSAFPTDAPTDKALRVALRYEVGRFFGSVVRLTSAVNRNAYDEAFLAYSDMALHFDRYMRVGGLYTFYDDIIDLEKLYEGIKDDELQFADPAKDPPVVRDLVLLIKGPDKGRTGILIGVYPDDKMAVKLDRYKGIREIRVVEKNWVAKRVGEQEPDDVFSISSSS